MEILSEFANVLLAAAAVAFVTFITSRQFRDLKDDLRDTKHEMRAGFARVDAEIAGLRVEVGNVRSDLGSEIGSLRSELGSEIASVRSDITQIALAFGARPRPQTG